MTISKIWKSISSFVLAWCLSSLALAQTTVTTYPVTSDTFVRSSASNNSFGWGGNVIVGGWDDMSLGMMKVNNFASLPVLGTGGKAELWVFNIASGYAPTQVRVGLTAIPWSESSTWNSGSLSWYTSSITTNNVSSGGYWSAIDVTVGYNMAKSGQVPYYGWYLVPVNTNGQFNFFASAENSNTTWRPFLKVTVPAQVVTDPYRFLSFPLKATGFVDWKTAPITSVMDHAKYSIKPTQPGYTDSNTTTTAFNGESAVNYNGNYNTNWCPNRASSLSYLDHPIGGKIPYQGATDSTGCAGTKTLSYNGHNGYDYAVPNGTVVYAAADGVVTENQCIAVNGSCLGYSVGRVILKHIVDVGNGVKKIYYTWYMHLSKAVTEDGKPYKVGAVIAAGKQLGLSGATGAGSAYHLHFEMRVGGDGTINGYGANVDPYGWYGNGADPLQTTYQYQDPYQKADHSNRLLWK